MLAEKYRPQTFDSVVGQQRTINALRWYLDNEHDSGLALLLTGPSGSGKTTLAECAARYWGVNEYSMRKLESAETDVQALRELSDDMYVYGLGQDGRKLYIIDEIHTVTGRAADRMLSLLEGMPAHVMIVGTTTETDWTDGILFSRWIRLELQKVSSSEVARHLERIADLERLPIPSDPKWADKLVKYHGLNIRDQLNQLAARLLASAEPAVA